MAKKYRVMNPRRASCPSGRDLLILDGRKYSEGDEYTPPTGKDIKRLVDGGFLKEVRDGRSGSGREAERDMQPVPPAAGRSRRVAEGETPSVPSEGVVKADG